MPQATAKRAARLGRIPQAEIMGGGPIQIMLKRVTRI